MKVSFVFDDGFIQSCLKVAEIYEARGLRATFAVLVHHEGFMVDYPKGDMELWNELVSRGHIVHPHGWDHTDLTTISHEEACDSINRTIEYFKEHLTGFVPEDAIFHFPYNRSTPELESFTLERVGAIRTTGELGQVGDGCNSIKNVRERRYQCFWHGPEYCDAEVQSALAVAQRTAVEHFMVMLHGLDGEGWGPIRSLALESLLDQIMTDDAMSYDDLRTIRRV